MAPIRARIEEIRLEGSAAQELYSGSISEALEGISFEDLTDPLRAAEFYEVAYNRGRGIENSREIYRRVFGDAYIFDYEVLAYGSDEKLVYFTPRLSIPAEKDEERLARTAEMVEAVHRANIELVGANELAMIEVFDDDLGYHESYSITFDEEDSQWILSATYRGELYRATELIDILRKTPTYN